MRAPVVVAFSGELDLYGVERVRAALEAVDGPAIIDLSDVRFIDASVLTELVRLRKRVGDCVTLVVPAPHIRRTLEIVRFAALFRIVRTRDEA